MSLLLRENLSFDDANMRLDYLTEGEGENAKKKLYMTGTFIQGGVRNLNRRVYPVNEIRNAVHSIQESIDKGDSILGELDHPEELTVNLDRVTHVIRKMWFDDSIGYGKLEILPTPMGNIAKTLLDSGVKLGVSSRGSGNVDSNGYVSDFEIITVDIVAKPSAQGAYPKAIYEARNMKRGAVIEDLATAVSHDPKAQKYLTEELKKFIESLK
jgi:hypothetical protein